MALVHEGKQTVQGTALVRTTLAHEGKQTVQRTAPMQTSPAQDDRAQKCKTAWRVAYMMAYRIASTTAQMC